MEITIEATVAGKLVAVYFFHDKLGGCFANTELREVQGSQARNIMAHAEVDWQRRVRRPPAWTTLSAMKMHSGEWSIGERAVWIVLALLWHLPLRGLELFAENEGGGHGMYCLRRGDLAFFRGKEQLGMEGRYAAGSVAIRFMGSKGDHRRKRAVLMRTPGGRGGGLLEERDWCICW